jgi:hypothetical protein
MRRLIATGFICIIATMCICTLLTIRAIENIADTLDKDESRQTITYEQVNQADEMSYMTYDELLMFDAMIYNDLYLEEYCTNLCEECDTYYYKECMCDSCYSDCIDCLEYDYELFVMDYYDMIMDEYEEILQGIIDSRNNPKVEIKICKF